MKERDGSRGDSEAFLTPSDIDSLLTREVRTAIESAGRDEKLWEEAKRSPEAFMRSRDAQVQEPLRIAFLDVVQSGDHVQFVGPDGVTVLEMLCPPTNVWWTFCRTIVRICEKRMVIVKGKVTTVDVNCHFVCAEFIWDREWTLPKRPPWPPVPLPHPQPHL